MLSTTGIDQIPANVLQIRIFDLTRDEHTGCFKAESDDRGVHIRALFTELLRCQEAPGAPQRPHRHGLPLPEFLCTSARPLDHLHSRPV
ncbi:hypothetical protein KUCAC02_019211 [Chaenocephalus aceratus]|uniref:Uncharacterized protein n=1 Tax=Chaenocephalus aceratus TaxID=36190 RepID=A0ACB9WAS1_CHAAC|nr:hypothetical protein KUCAC02_019211 [Chaenocephalus aceratus]